MSEVDEGTINYSTTERFFVHRYIVVQLLSCFKYISLVYTTQVNSTFRAR